MSLQDVVEEGTGEVFLVAAGVALAIEKTGTNAEETLRGTAQHDTLYGRGGNDRLLGLGENDTLIGGSGNDTCKDLQGPTSSTVSRAPTL